MSFLNKIFNRKSDLASQEQSTKNAAYPALILLFDRLPPIQPGTISQTIKTVEPIQTDVQVQPIMGKTVVSYITVSYDTHKLRLASIAAPVPPATLERTVQVSNWRQDQKEPLRRHQSHMICFYDGSHPDPGEQLIALYKLAYSFYDQGLLGVLDEQAWNCLPAEFLKEQMRPAMLQECRKAVPLGLWTGFVKFFRPDGKVWFCTKGHERFATPNFALLGDISQADMAFDLFEMLFRYVREYGAVLQVGETVQAGNDLFLRFSAVSEYPDYLESPGGTLVIERIQQ